MILHSLFIKIGSALMALGLFFGAQTPSATQSFGDVTPVGASQFTLAGSGITSTQSTIQLTSFKTPDGRPIVMSMFGTVGYGALEPQTVAKIEDVTFSGVVQNTNGTATLTGVTRGNDFVTPYAASTTLAHAHAGGATFILTNTAGFYTQFASINNAETISGIWSFAPASPPQYSSAYTATGNQFVSFAQLNNVVLQGAATSTETGMGIVQLANASQVGASTASSTTGAPLVIENKFATTTPGTICTGGSWKCIVATVNGKISQSFYDLTQSFTFSGGILSTASSTYSATTTIQASNVLSKALILNGQPYSFPSFALNTATQGTASTTVWAFDSTGKATYLAIASSTQGILSVAANSGANAIVTGFKPRIIRVNWTYASGGNGIVLPLGGHGTYNVQTGKYAETYVYNSGVSGGQATPTAAADTTQIMFGQVDSSASGSFTGTIGSITTTGFTLTLANATGASPTVKIEWEADI